MRPATHALRLLGALLLYPEPGLRALLPEIAAEIANDGSLRRIDRERLADLLGELMRADGLDAEEAYVGLFDRGRAASLHLFEHLHGESRDRGEAMVQLAGVYQQAGFLLKPGELPDYLPALLEFLGCRPPADAKAIMADCGHLVRKIGEAVAARGSRYAAIFDAALVLAGEAGLDWAKGIEPEPLDNVDDDWMDTPAFAKPDEQAATSTIRFMPRPGR
ncbi:nitrate reductase molybdenum cofactor assembly chaperone [Jeongeupia naejangsanensis]|uniref:Nitrate reductase molybdenum cofactor assembly chaperone n=1 Tax=Jeongeupia naejangsanensis TaxID=613195 RepID=A0ABS2BMK6_9NEIS|nr:nitrate reductase molybdenum cofactor assembly chaperone [Jeongeupia naejangsanensis]MBM3116838.1 nitrate reductase molybdenum cofactor assembly chaperone [Jeongeupia naejangsanensis]